MVNLGVVLSVFVGFLLDFLQGLDGWLDAGSCVLSTSSAVWRRAVEVGGRR